MISEYLQKHILVTDGATGTYYAELTGDTSDYCELANLNRPELIQQIHREYLAAGAKLIRTNTFAANTQTLDLDRHQLAELIHLAVRHAQAAATGYDCFIAANIGPIPELSLESTLPNDPVSDEYRYLVDTFLDAGLDIFNFETFSSLDYLSEMSAYIKSRNNRAFVITQFVVTPDGFTRKGVHAHNIISQLRQIPSIDAYGFNCGVGPTHLNRIIATIDLGDNLVAALPNAGYPEIVNERTIYVHNPEYFAERMISLEHRGIKILGGCCGTTPMHIQALTKVLQFSQTHQPAQSFHVSIPAIPKKSASIDQRVQPKSNQLLIAAELDPPFDTAIEKIMQGAAAYKAAGIDLITIADSPLGKARVDSVAMAAKIKREVGVNTLPHLCCRDRNINALKSTILAAHIEGIRTILAVTGDPLSNATTKNDIKNVFNFNSLTLIRFLNNLNNDVFPEEPITIAAALNLNVPKKEIEIERMLRKTENGARLFLTQPIFDDQVSAFFPTIPKPEGVKILAGILPIVNRRNALFLQNELPGVTIPDEHVARFHETMSREEAQEEGIRLAVETAEKLKPYVDGFYFMTPFNRTGMIIEILKRLNLNPS